MHMSILRGSPFPNDSQLRPSGLPFHIHFHPHKTTRLRKNINAFQRKPVLRNSRRDRIALAPTFAQDLPMSAGLDRTRRG